MEQKNYQFKIVKLNGDILTPIMIFTRLKGAGKFLFESSLPNDSNGRFSFIGSKPAKEFIGTADTVTVIDHMSGRTEKKTGKPLEIIKEALPRIDIPLPFPFYGGAVGYIGYDTIRQYEEIGAVPEDEIGIPDLHVMVYQNVAVYDHKSQTVYLVSIHEDGQVIEKNLEAMEKAIFKQTKAEPFVDLGPVEFVPSIEKAAFMQMVEKAKQHIEAGDIFQVVLSQRMKGKLDHNPFYFYRKLRKANPSPYMFYLDFGSYVVLGASPESLIKTKGTTVYTNPIAGTRPRGQSEAEDVSLEKDLLQDEKELAEHKMLVDLSRNDLGRVCVPGTVHVHKYMAVERFQTVMHIVSEVQGELKQGYSGVDALVSCIPAGTVSGAPKIRAMQIINELEKQKRGMYAGAVGYINFNGDIDFALAIRSLLIKGHTAYLQSGAGIVYDSDPAQEYQETLNKAKSILEVQANDFITR
ncbi:anthranilate synthase component I [Heyndrickxia acidiproducens]|uniref:anthranilate synthase component I n=1 Tax=Heyndrickxia acidiproducens TaxID=1121084 RepID=UPI0004754E36|nr:anthranilate synthase component I [Heyndrickxia acidiproducens]